MAGDGPYSLEISVVANTTGPIWYVFHARDLQGNYASTASGNVSIIDDDGPVLGTDLTPTSGTTGDPLTFKVDATDNIGIRSVYVDYWYNGGPVNRGLMTGAGQYEYTITVQSSSTADLIYFFTVNDLSNNTVTTVERRIIIRDDDMPEFGIDSTPNASGTGDVLEFSITASDNIGITGAFLEYSFGSSSSTNVSILMNGSTVQHRITVPTNYTGGIRYRFLAEDASGNWAVTPFRSLWVWDNDLPMLVFDSSPTKGKGGEDLTFHAKVEDNCGIANVQVEYWTDEDEHQFVEMNATGYATIRLPDEGGTLYYRFLINDTAGNLRTTETKEISFSDRVDNTLCLIVLAVLFVIVAVSGFMWLKRKSEEQNAPSPVEGAEDVPEMDPMDE
jgi:hypothetical protein